MPVWRNNPWALATAASVDIVTANNVTWTDSFQFDPPGVTGQPPPPYWPQGATGPTWTFAGQSFRLDIKAYVDGPTALLSMDSGQVPNVQVFNVIDSVNRILAMNVPEGTIDGTTMATGCTGAGLIPGEYFYDLIMYDTEVPSVRTMLMRGKFVLQAGITGG